jgi:hypothetical protein
MQIDYSTLADQYRKGQLLPKPKEETYVPTPSSSTDTGAKTGLGKAVSGIFSGIGKLAKPIAQSLVRGATQSAAIVGSNIWNKPVEIAGAKAYPGFDKRNLQSGLGAALETLSLLPAGKALTALRAKPLTSLTKAEMFQLANLEAGLGIKSGAAGGAGSTLSEVEGATAADVAGGTLMGGTLGAGLGLASPYLARGASNVWTKAADLLFDRQIAKEASTALRTKATPVEGGMTKVESITGNIKSSLDVDPDHDLLPPPAPDAKPLEVKISKKAKKLGISDAHITNLSEMSSEEFVQGKTMREMAEKRAQDFFSPHPMQTAAKPIVEQVERLKVVAKKSGEALDDLMEAMPNNAIPLETFIDGQRTGVITRLKSFLDQKGIRIVKAKDGTIRGLNFGRSIFRGSTSSGDRNIIKEVFNELHPPRAGSLTIYRTPKEIRNIRQTWRLLSEKMKKSSASSPYSGELETFINQLRSDLLKPLANISPEFDKANRNYAVAKNAVEKFYKFLGRDFVGAEEQNLTERVAELLPRLVSNTSSKPGVVLKMLGDASRGVGIPEEFIKDPRRLIYLSELLDDTYGLHAIRGFQGSIQRAGGNIMEGAQAGLDLASGRPLSAFQKAAGIFQTPVNEKRIQWLNDVFANAPETPIKTGKVNVAEALRTEVKETLPTEAGDFRTHPEYIRSAEYLRSIEDDIVENLKKEDLQVVDSDKLKKMIPDAQLDTEDVKLNEAFHEASSESAKRIWTRILSESPHNDVYIFGGMSGSGKTEFLKGGLEKMETKGVVWDGTMSGLDSTLKRIKQAQELGKSVHIKFIVPDPEASLKFIQERARLEGRNVPREVAMKTYTDGIKTLQALTKKKNLGVDFNVIHTSGKSKEQIMEAVRRGGIKNKKEIQKMTGDLIDGMNPRESVSSTLKREASQSSVGAFAGFQPEYDEEGKFKGFKFDPKLGAMGMVGAFAVGKAKKTGIFNGFDDISTPILEKLKGREKVSRQFIDDLTRQQGLKKAEVDLVKGTLENFKDAEINVKEFAESVKSELLPLTWTENFHGNTRNSKWINKTYEEFVLPTALRKGDSRVKKYNEKIYESPIQNSSWKKHFRPEYHVSGIFKRFKGYFGHTRVEDMLDDKTRRIIEIQSDLFQNHGIEKEISKIKNIGKIAEFEKIKKQYTDPTAHYRMVREEIKQASIDRKTKLQFPTGETAMIIQNRDLGWTHKDGSTIGTHKLKIGGFVKDEDSKLDGVIVGLPGRDRPNQIAIFPLLKNVEIFDTREEAIRASFWGSAIKLENGKYIKGSSDDIADSIFGVVGKTEDDPVYKFYEKDIGEYLKKNHNAKLITDKQDVSWWEVPISKEDAKRPVGAFGKLDLDKKQNTNIKMQSVFRGDLKSGSKRKTSGIIKGKTEFGDAPFVSFSDNRELATEFGDTIGEYQLNMSRILDLENSNDKQALGIINNQIDPSKEQVKKLKELGYDGISFKNLEDNFDNIKMTGKEIRYFGDFVIDKKS